MEWKRILLLFLLVVGAFFHGAYAKEAKVEKKYSVLGSAENEENGSCEGDNIRYGGEFDIGDILVRGYQESPGWADTIALGWLEYHHSAIIVVGGSPKDAFTMEALGKNRDPKKEIRKRAFLDTEWTTTANSAGECNRINIYGG